MFRTAAVGGIEESYKGEKMVSELLRCFRGD